MASATWGSGLSTFSSLVFFDLMPVFQELFTPKWCEGRMLVNATATLGDYCRDFHDHLHGFFFNKLM